MKHSLLALSTGFALFSMFFGSGNLVFPLVVGAEGNGHYLLAALGIILTGVLVPFLGVFGMLLFKGDTRSFFGCMGKAGTFWFPLVALSLMGPFGVLARCLTVAHGGLQLLIPNLSLPLTSAILCLTIYLLAVNKNKIVPVLGTFLTPFLLVSLAAIGIFGLAQYPLPEALPGAAFEALKNGFFQGYQTMDLLAAFFFSTFVLKHLDKTAAEHPERPSPTKVFIRAAFVGSGLLSVVYLGLVLLGAAYGPELSGVPPQEMLGLIAMKALGPLAAPGVCIAMVLACLTTAIVLASLFADFLRHEVTQDKIGNHTAMIVTLVISFLVSTLDFAGIARFLGPILEAIYPALITLTLMNIAHKCWGLKHSHWPVTMTLAARMLSL